VQENTINGFPAATATATGEGWSFRLYVIRYGSDVYRFIFAARERSHEADRSFREAVSTFRRMSLKEASQVKPMRLAVVTVGARDTAESLARRMAVSDHALETFRVINGLSREDRLKAGERVKIVVE
jgi:predicted Zn-dependent protease